MWTAGLHPANLQLLQVDAMLVMHIIQCCSSRLGLLIHLLCSLYAKQQHQGQGWCSVALSYAVACTQTPHGLSEGSSPVLWFDQACYCVAYSYSTSIDKRLLESHVGCMRAVKVW